MRTVTLRVGEGVRIGEFRVSVAALEDGSVQWEVLAPEGTAVRLDGGIPLQIRCPTQ